MANKAYAAATGAFVLLLAAGLAVMAVWLSGYRVARVPYVLVSQHSVSGLRPQATVFYRGVPVGTVDTIRLDPHDFRNILVRIEIDPELPITRGTYGLLQPQGITGVNDVELADSGKDPRPLPTSAAAPARMPLGPSVLNSLLTSGQTLVARLSQLAADLDRFAGADNRTHVAQILANTEAASRQLATVEKQLQATLTTAADLGRHAQHTLADVDVVAKRLQTLSGTLDTLARSATALSRTGNAAGETLRRTTLPRLDALLSQMRETTQRLQQFATTLQQDPQSLLYGHRPPPGPGEPGYNK